MFKCPYCGVTANKKGEEFTSQGSLNLHVRSCKEKKEEISYDDEQMVMVGVNKEKFKGLKCPECGEKLKLLNPNVSWCKAPIKEGFEKVCMNCEVVY